MAYFKTLYRYSPCQTDENHKQFSQDNRSSGQNSNSGHSE